MVFKKYKDTKTSFELDFPPIKYKISISSEDPIEDLVQELAKEKGLNSTKEILQSYLDKRIRKVFKSKYDLLKDCPSYQSFVIELKAKVKNKVCGGNISKALRDDVIKECEKYEI